MFDFKIISTLCLGLWVGACSTPPAYPPSGRVSPLPSMNTQAILEFDCASVALYPTYIYDMAVAPDGKNIIFAYIQPHDTATGQKTRILPVKVDHAGKASFIRTPNEKCLEFKYQAWLAAKSNSELAIGTSDGSNAGILVLDFEAGKHTLLQDIPVSKLKNIPSDVETKLSVGELYVNNTNQIFASFVVEGFPQRNIAFQNSIGYFQFTDLKQPPKLLYADENIASKIGASFIVSTPSTTLIMGRVKVPAPYVKKISIELPLSANASHVHNTRIAALPNDDVVIALENDIYILNGQTFNIQKHFQGGFKIEPSSGIQTLADQPPVPANIPIKTGLIRFLDTDQAGNIYILDGFAGEERILMLNPNTHYLKTIFSNNVQ